MERLAVCLIGMIFSLISLAVTAEEPAAMAQPLPEPLYSKNQLSLKPYARVRGESWDQTDLHSRRTSLLTQLRIGVLYEATHDFSVLISPQYFKVFGDEYSLTQTGPTYDVAFGLHETYALYKGLEFFNFTLGRMTLSYGDELILGKDTWDPQDHLYDGLKINYSREKIKADIFANRIANKKDSLNYANSSGFNQTEKYLYGIYVNSYVTDWLQEADAYFLYHTQAPLVGTRVEMNIYGLRVKSPVGAFDYRAEMTKELNSSFTDLDTAIQIDGELGYTIIPEKKLRLALEGFVAGRNYVPAFSNQHKLFGTSDVLGQRNILGYGVHLSSNFSEKWSASTDYYTFNRSTPDASAYKTDGLENLGTISGSAAMNIGSELDLQAKYQLNEVVAVSVGGGFFFFGPYLTDQFLRSNASFGHLTFESTF
jgi:hypothetical protein